MLRLVLTKFGGGRVAPRTFVWPIPRRSPILWKNVFQSQRYVDSSFKKTLPKYLFRLTSEDEDFTITMAACS